ncbi:MAG TPA: nucleotide exchange factor GrpE [Chloroflexi bacterium]|nr:nucleotide exchange factor GrpE [Chloroflexota bacterium]
MYWNDNPRAYKIPLRRREDRLPASPVGAEITPVKPKLTPSQFEETSLPEAERAARDEIKTPASDEVNWKTAARQLRADMDNFRRRQTRRADESIAAERERLLRRFLPLADGLERALYHSAQDDASLQEGVEALSRQLMNLLKAEGVTPIEALAQPFDPELHEAIATVPADAEAGTIVDQIESGYKLKDKLLRPAKVVVAQ